MGLLEKIKEKKGGLGAFSDGYGYLVYPELCGLIKNRMHFNGKEVIVWSHNDYLGLSCDERVMRVESEAIKNFGISYPGGSRLLSGNTSYHEELEDELEKLIGKKIMLLNLVYAGSISILQSLLDRNDILLYDQSVHASLIDGIRTHTGTRLSFRHNDVEHLHAQLTKCQQRRNVNSQMAVVVDGVYSMSGDVTNLDQIAGLKRDFDFTLVLDDSHGFMVFEEGTTPDSFHLMNHVDIYIASFGKALGNVGGFVAADKSFIDYFKFTLRSQIFGRSLSVINIISTLFKLKIIRDDQSIYLRLWSNTKRLQLGLRELHFNIGNTSSPITPLYLNGDGNIAAAWMSMLREEFNIFCSGVTYPVTPKGLTLLRLIPTALHTIQDIEFTLQAFRSVLKRIELEPNIFTK
jgi:glycine C-acetyltransferase